MALIVEDGTRPAGANSYLSVADADAYHTLMANAAWADASGPDKEAALIRATAGIDTKYKGQWIGVKSVTGQRLAWPRAKVIDTDQPIVTVEGESIPVSGAGAIPAALRDATAEVALIELTTRFVQRTVTKNDMVKREKVDVIETEFFASAQQLAAPLYPYIDSLLEGLASSALNTLSMVIGVTEYEQTEIDKANSNELDYLRDDRYFLSS